MTISGYIPQADYFQILRLVPIVCVDVAITQDDTVLLVKRKDKPAQGQWWFPGGRVHKGESLKQAALRKAKEEVRLNCEAGKIIHTAETVFEDGPEGIPVHSVNTIFMLSSVDDSQVILDNNHSAYLWIDAKWVKANDNSLDPYMIEGLEKIFNPKVNHYDNLRKILCGDIWHEDIAYYVQLYHEHFAEGKELDYHYRSAIDFLLSIIND